MRSILALTAYLDHNFEQSDGWLNVSRQCAGTQKTSYPSGAARISEDMSSGVDGVRTLTPFFLLLLILLRAASDRGTFFEQVFVSVLDNVAKRLIGGAQQGCGVSNRTIRLRQGLFD